MDTYPPLVAVDVDHLLGPCTARYFGTGYQRVAHQISNLMINPHGGADGGTVEAVASVRYPADWSRKRSGDLRPHLSTIDALLVAVQLSEAYLLRSFDLGPDLRGRMWLRRFAMRAGSTPLEDLEDFRVTAKHVLTERPDAVSGEHVTVLDCVVGPIKVRCEIGHPEAPSRAAVPSRHDDIEDILGPASERWYGAAYAARRERMRDIRLSENGDYGQAVVVSRLDDQGEEVEQGLEAYYGSNVSMIDAIVAVAQITQIVLYHQDGVERGQTNTMWMRQVAMESRSPYRPTTNPALISVAVVKSKVLDFAGGKWRTTDFAGHFHGIEISHSVAHELPAEGVETAESAKTAGSAAIA